VKEDVRDRKEGGGEDGESSCRRDEVFFSVLCSTWSSSSATCSYSEESVSVVSEESLDQCLTYPLVLMSAHCDKALIVVSKKDYDTYCDFGVKTRGD
jgi:hypothetical protein